MLVVTVREGEESEMCSAVMRELLTIVKDQIAEECAVAVVLSRKSTILEKSDCENFAEEKTDERHRR